MSFRWLKKSRPAVTVNRTCCVDVVTASTFMVEVPRMRQRSSLFLSSANVCNGFDVENTFAGYTPFTARKSMKLGVDGNTRNGLVPVLSLFEIPRCARLWIAFRLTLTLNRLPTSWSRLARTACF